VPAGQKIPSIFVIIIPAQYTTTGYVLDQTYVHPHKCKVSIA